MIKLSFKTQEVLDLDMTALLPIFYFYLWYSLFFLIITDTEIGTQQPAVGAHAYVCCVAEVLCSGLFYLKKLFLCNFFFCM